MRGLLAATGVFVLAVALLAGIESPVSNARPAKTCPRGDVHAVVRGAHVCRAAVDLEVSVVGRPAATRVGGTVTYSVTVRNRGRLRAQRVVLRLAAPAEIVSASAGGRPCTTAGSPPRTQCTFAAVAARGRASVTVVARASALGALTLSASATSSARDARAADNTTRTTTRVTEPDSVRGRGARRLFGGTTPGFVVVDVDAIGAPLGGEAAGTFFTSYGSSTEVRGTVVCLTVSGNRASVGGVVEQSNEPTWPVGSGVLLGFTDVGPAGDTQVSYLNQANPRSCPVPLFENQPEVALDSGDFVVVDTR